MNCAGTLLNAADAVLGADLVAAREDRIALRFDGQTMSYRELAGLINRVGNVLRARGVGVGDRVLLLLNDSPWLVGAYLAAIKIGAVAVALNVRFSTDDLHFVFDDSAPACLITNHEYVPICEQIARNRTTQLLVLGDANASFEALEPAVSNASSDLESLPRTPEDPAFLIYTSGTTGRPKAALHPHRSAFALDRFMREVLGITADDRLFATSKLFFAYALGQCLFGSLKLGSSSVLLAAWPSSTAVAATLQREAPTVVFSVPAMYRNLLRDGVAGQAAFTRVRHYVSAGERLPIALAERWRAATGVPILDGMGTSETITFVLANRPGANRPGTAGRVCPDVQVELRDPENGRPTDSAESADSGEPAGAPGVLWVRSASLCQGYWNRDPANRAFASGWFCTRDQFTIDGDGYYTHVGRVDDMLKISGQWVSPTEIEDQIQWPGVGETAVVGVPDTDGLTSLWLFVETEEDDQEPALKTRLRDHLLARLSGYKCPRHIRFLPELPRTTTGKVRRNALRELARSDDGDDGDD